MDTFTEKILERARQRQKNMLERGGSDNAIHDLNEINSTKSHSAPEISQESNGPLPVNGVLDVQDVHNEFSVVRETMSEGNLVKFLTVSSDMPGSPQPHLKTFNIQKENFNMEIKLSSTDDVRVQVEFQDVDDKENQEVESIIRDGVRKRLERLGKMYAGGDDADISSPIHRTEATFSVVENPNTIPGTKPFSGKERKGLEGLAALAKNIHDWEDDSAPTTVDNTKQEAMSPKRHVKLPAPRPPISSCNNISRHNKPKAPHPPVTSQELHFDEKLINALEAQGFTRTISNSSLTYKYEESKLDKVEHEISDSKPINSPSKNIIARAAMFEHLSPNRSNGTKDPALLSVSERKALFEKNKGTALLPKAPITMAAPLDNKKSPTKSCLPTKLDKTVHVSPSKTKYVAPRPPIRQQDDAYKVMPGKSGGIASKVAALFQNKSTISQQQIEDETREQRQKEMDILLKRFPKSKDNTDNVVEGDSDNEDSTETTAMLSSKPSPLKKLVVAMSPPKPPPLPPPTSSGLKRLSQGKRCSGGDSPQVAAILEDVKRIKVSPLKPGKLYPCLSDIEAVTEAETEFNTATSSSNSSFGDNNYSASESDLGDSSFGRQVLETVYKNETPLKQPVFHDTTESDISDILDGTDDYLDEAMIYNKSDSIGPSPPKQGRSESPIESSNSFHYKDCSPFKKGDQSPLKRKSASKRKSSETSELPTHVVDGDNILPLTHTVSFYRKQQNEGTKPAAKKIVRTVILEESLQDTTNNEDAEVQQKIGNLLDEIKKQQTIIAQTSQALNLCYSTPEFIGSTEQVEAERVLLLATHRRSAAQREVERLQVLKSLTNNDQNNGVLLEKGALVISNIVLPLKRDYVRALNATGGKGHHVICLVKCAEQVLCTKLVSTVATNDRNPDLELRIPGVLRLENVYSNFTVQFEVFCLQAQEEVLPHEVKYHINKKVSKLTPRKGKGESRLLRPIKESPAGPHTVRTPTFSLMGYVVFSLQGINRKNWSLNNAPSMSPLEGIVEMVIKCELSISVEHRGFLTMLEDVSGYGNWYRRWCLLRGHTLSYWKYPEDERKKVPIGNIDLKHCITQQIGPVRRDICARQHTMLIETTRRVMPDDKNSLFMECTGDTTILRNLLSADTKEERIQWCTMFNKMLMNIRVCSTK